MRNPPATVAARARGTPAIQPEDEVTQLEQWTMTPLNDLSTGQNDLRPPLELELEGTSGLREALAAVLERTGGDAELAGELAALFLEDAPALLANVRRAIAERDGGALKRHAHRVKGAIAVFDAGTAFQTAARLEALGEQGHVAAAAPDVEVLAAALLQLQRMLVHLTTAPVSTSSVPDAALRPSAYNRNWPQTRSA